jgi:hypothetical protein
MKICSECLTEKEDDCFSLNGTRMRGQCKSCRNIQAKQYRSENKDKIRAKDKTYYDQHKDAILARNKVYCENNRVNICANKRIYYEANKDKIKQYHQCNKSNRNIRIKLRRKQVPHIRVKASLAARIHNLLKSKTHNTWKYIGCSNIELQTWLEYQFTDQMSWDNYGMYWHIDHVIPLYAFNILSSEHQHICLNWSNLRPLLKEQNLHKSNKIILKDICQHKLIYQSFISLNPWYQALPEKAWWSRQQLEYGKNPEDDFVKWFTKEMGNPQRRSLKG